MIALSHIRTANPAPLTTFERFCQFVQLSGKKHKLKFLSQLISDNLSATYMVSQNLAISGKRHIKKSRTLEDIPSIKKAFPDAILNYELAQRKYSLELEQRCEKLVSMALPLPAITLKRMLEEVDEKKERWFSDTRHHQLIPIIPRIHQVRITSNYPGYIVAFSKSEIYFMCLDINASPNPYIGSGSYKKVYKIWQITEPKLRAVSISTLLKNNEKRNITEEYWNTEEACLIRLNGKKIESKYVSVKLYAGFRTYSHSDDRQFLIMKYIPISLEDIIKYPFYEFNNPKAVKMPDRTKIDLGIKIMKCIAYMHSQGVVSRDLKPENFLLKNNDVFAIDFGLACKADYPHFHHDHKGTPLYYPFEYFANIKGMSCRLMSIFTAGCILWQLFAEKNYPWVDYMEDNGIYCETHKKGVAKIIRDFNNNVPPEGSLKHLFWEMWHIDPQARPSAADVVKKLELIKSDLFDKDSKDTFDFPSLLGYKEPRISDKEIKQDISI